MVTPARPCVLPPEFPSTDLRVFIAEAEVMLGERFLPATSQPAQLGWAVDVVDGKVLAYPVLADELRQCGQEVGDLELIDASVAAAGPDERLDLWRKSLGRALVMDVSVLACVRLSPNDWETLVSASGADRDPGVFGAPWRALHAGVPGDNTTWAPISNDASEALYLLEHGETAHGRGAALEWLLNRLVLSPIVSVGGMRLNVKDQLPSRLSMLLSPGAPGSRERRALAEVEHLCLTHAALIAGALCPDAPVREVWHVARWIQGIATRSPFYGGNLALVAARLRAALPAEGLPQVGDEVPADHPLRFAREDADGIPIEDAGILHGLLRHLHAVTRDHLKSASEPVMDWLYRLAGRPCTSPELAAERASRAGWPYRNVAVPMLARWVLTDVYTLPWLKSASAEARSEVVGMLSSPAAPWVARALGREGEVVLTSELLELWRTSTAEWASDLGVGLVRDFSDSDWGTLLDQVRLQTEWQQVGLLSRIIKLAPAQVAGKAATRLVELTSTGESDRVRERAAFRAIEELREPIPGRDRLLELLGLAIQEPPLNRRPELLAWHRKWCAG